MSDKSLALAQRSGKTQSVALEMVPAELRMPASILANDPTQRFLDRQRLRKLEANAKAQLLMDNLAAKVRLERLRLAKTEEVTGAAISAYGDQLLYKIRHELTKTLRRSGLKVNEEQLRLLTDFAERLTLFKRELQSRQLDAKYRKQILSAVDGAFDLVVEQLGRLAREMFAPAVAETE